MESPDGPRRPTTGLCFGSVFLGSNQNRIYELLPGNYFSRVTNIEDFWLAWLLDVCASHADNRQALFPSGLKGTLYAVFIDHGHMFGGPNGDLHPCFGKSRYLDPRPYHSLTERLAKRLKAVALNLDVDALWAEASHLPEEWTSDTALQQLSACLSSLSCAGIVQGALEALLELNPQAHEIYRHDRFGRESSISLTRRSRKHRPHHIEEDLTSRGNVFTRVVSQ